MYLSIYLQFQRTHVSSLNSYCSANTPLWAFKSNPQTGSCHSSSTCTSKPDVFFRSSTFSILDMFVYRLDVSSNDSMRPCLSQACSHGMALSPRSATWGKEPCECFCCVDLLQKGNLQPKVVQGSCVVWRVSLRSRCHYIVFIIYISLVAKLTWSLMVWWRSCALMDLQCITYGLCAPEPILVGKWVFKGLHDQRWS